MGSASYRWLGAFFVVINKTKVSMNIKMEIQSLRHKMYITTSKKRLITGLIVLSILTSVGGLMIGYHTAISENKMAANVSIIKLSPTETDNGYFGSPTPTIKVLVKKPVSVLPTPTNTSQLPTIREIHTTEQIIVVVTATQAPTPTIDTSPFEIVSYDPQTGIITTNKPIKLCSWNGGHGAASQQFVFPTSYSCKVRIPQEGETVSGSVTDFSGQTKDF